MIRDFVFFGFIGICGVNFFRGTERYKDLDVMKFFSLILIILIRGFLFSFKS